MIKQLYIFSILLLMLNFSMAQNHEPFIKEHFTLNGDTLHYRILYPENFSKTKKYPLILFLHGAGERGNDNYTQLTHGSQLFLDNKTSNSFPAIVVFPQCPKNEYWSNVSINRSKQGLDKFKFNKSGAPTKPMNLVLKLMDELTSQPYINNNRLYVGGLSMGGMGTFEILHRRPNMFAAAFPICGGGNPKTVTKYAKNVSLWVFHGGKDDIVHPYYSLIMVAALQKYNADVTLTYFESDNHNSWDSTFSEPNLLNWLFSKSKI